MAAKTYLSERLRDARKKAGLSASEAGKRLNRSGKTIQAWEAGTNEPSPELLIDACRVYNIPISFFFPDDVSQRAKHEDVGLSEENELLSVYRSVSAAGKRALMVSARAIALEYPKSDSISEGIA